MLTTAQATWLTIKKSVTENVGAGSFSVKQVDYRAVDLEVWRACEVSIMEDLALARASKALCESS